MQVLQTLGRAVQLPLDFSEGSSEESEVTDQLQSVCVILADVLHYVPIHHPLRHGNELPFCYVFLSSNKSQDVWMG